MKKVVKKVLLSLLVFAVIVTSSIKLDVVTAASNARTLGELKSELAALKKKKADAVAKQNATKNQISTAKNDVSSKQNQIAENQQKVIDATTESEQLEIDIEEGKEDIAKVLSAYQLANGDNVYLEYIFAATSYEDLLYRYSVMEQIMTYQQEQIDSWNDKVAQNEQLKVELAQLEVTLNSQIDSLSTKIDDLNDDLSTYFDLTMDIDDEISSTNDLIKYYEQIGCKDNEDLNECVKIKGDTGFRKPVTKGTITSVFGYRTHPVTGIANTFHSGIDIGGSSPYEGSSVYSIANGMVGKIIYKASCGGNQVYIYHTINGKKYTSAYLHLKAINVSLGQSVTSNTVVGTVGGYSTSTAHGGYDTCSTGAHLHLSLATGWYGSTYTSYSSWRANLIDPQKTLNLPNKGTYWYSR